MKSLRHTEKAMEDNKKQARPDLTKEDRIKLCATAPKASAGTITQIEDGKMRTYWIGKLRGMFVGDLGGQYKFDSRAEAVECARQFREHAKNEAVRLGIAL